MNNFKNCCTTPKLMSFIRMIVQLPVALTVLILFFPLLHSLGSVQDMASSISSSLNQTEIDLKDLQGVWTWHTNPLRNPKESPKWKGSFTIKITEDDKRRNGFSGSYGDGTKIEDGRYGGSSLIWNRMTGTDEIGQNMQTWTVDKIEVTENNNIKMTGRWRGAFDKCCDNKGDDFDFVAVKQK